MSLRTTDPSDWPVFLAAREVGDIFGCSERSAQRKIAKGHFGKFFEMDGRRYVRRDELLRAIREREREPEQRDARSPFRRRR